MSDERRNETPSDAPISIDARASLSDYLQYGVGERGDASEDVAREGREFQTAANLDVLKKIKASIAPTTTTNVPNSEDDDQRDDDHTSKRVDYPYYPQEETRTTQFDAVFETSRERTSFRRVERNKETRPNPTEDATKIPTAKPPREEKLNFVKLARPLRARESERFDERATKNENEPRERATCPRPKDAKERERMPILRRFVDLVNAREETDGTNGTDGTDEPAREIDANSTYVLAAPCDAETTVVGAFADCDEPTRAF